MTKKKRLSPQQRADLRCCASCEFIFSQKEYLNEAECPVCKGATYGARFIHGDKAYQYKKTQIPFYKRLEDYATRRARAEGLALIHVAEATRRNNFMHIMNI